MLRITARVFFTAGPVKRAVDRATRRVLSRFGAFVRQRARTSIRRRRRTALPGEPPSSHTGLLRRGILFGYDRAKRSVVIGPTPLSKASPYGSVTVPQVLEEGGVVTAKRDGKRRRLRFRGNPYMGPAFRAEMPRLPRLWKDSVTPGR